MIPSDLSYVIAYALVGILLAELAAPVVRKVIAKSPSSVTSDASRFIFGYSVWAFFWPVTFLCLVAVLFSTPLRKK